MTGEFPHMWPLMWNFDVLYAVEHGNEQTVECFGRHSNKFTANHLKTTATATTMV